MEQGAQAHGFDADLWTLERVGQVVERVCGVRLSRAWMWRLLTARLGWSLQRPQRKAVERDEAEVARWVAHEWPRITRGRRRTGHGSCSSTNRACRCCLRCGAPTRPAAAPPTLRHRLNWKRASMAAALGYHATDAGIGRVCQDGQLAWSFLAHTGLEIHPRTPRN